MCRSVYSGQSCRRCSFSLEKVVLGLQQAVCRIFKKLERNRACRIIRDRGTRIYGCPHRDKCYKAKEEARRISVSQAMRRLKQEATERINTERGIVLRQNRSIQVEEAFSHIITFFIVCNIFTASSARIRFLRCFLVERLNARSALGEQVADTEDDLPQVEVPLKIRLSIA